MACEVQSQSKNSINVSDDGWGDNDDEDLILLLGCGHRGLEVGHICQLSGEKWQDPGCLLFILFFFLRVPQKLGRS